MGQISHNGHYHKNAYISSHFISPWALLYPSCRVKARSICQKCHQSLGRCQSCMIYARWRYYFVSWNVKIFDRSFGFLHLTCPRPQSPLSHFTSNFSSLLFLPRKVGLSSVAFTWNKWYWFVLILCCYVSSLLCFLFLSCRLMYPLCLCWANLSLPCRLGEPSGLS